MADGDDGQHRPSLLSGQKRKRVNEVKSVLWTSLLLVLIPALMFAPLYGLLIRTAGTSLADYRGDVVGTWEAIQYYDGKDRIACGAERNMGMTFGEDSLRIWGTILPETDTQIEWKSGTSFFVDMDGERTVIYLSFDSFNNLKLNVGADGIIVLLRRNGG